MTTIRVTHKGWFGLCPVYLGNLDDACPLVLERSRLLVPLMMLSEAMFGVVNWCMSALRPDHEPGWPIRVTGEIDGWNIEVPDDVEEA